ncbi:prepilin-type N-terminal cleavage/methylation domain-containing protein [Pseudidiomarina sp. CB1]|uniref:type IV pilus modification PilV family protein n=1 Tax=Pseudidiomarina sp. CB1 TaxID=2972484 RepID=UPI00216382F6|nr:type II secretion system protein [Pseudidiomarina sp. CB1]
MKQRSPLTWPSVTAATSMRGFTLIELIIGVVVLAFALSLVATLIFPQALRSAEPVLQVRAANLAQAFIEEIQGKSFDENSDRSGGSLRCGETGAPACSSTLGPDSETRERFDDIDDYHLLHVAQPNLQDALGTDISDDYRGFSYAIEVCYSDPQGSCSGTVTRFKRVQVTFTTAQSQDFTFAFIKGNY